MPPLEVERVSEAGLNRDVFGDGCVDRAVLQPVVLGDLFVLGFSPLEWHAEMAGVMPDRFVLSGELDPDGGQPGARGLTPRVRRFDLRGITLCERRAARRVDAAGRPMAAAHARAAAARRAPTSSTSGWVRPPGPHRGRGRATAADRCAACAAGGGLGGHGSTDRSSACRAAQAGAVGREGLLPPRRGAGRSPPAAADAQGARVGGAGAGGIGAAGAGRRGGAGRPAGVRRPPVPRARAGPAGDPVRARRGLPAHRRARPPRRAAQRARDAHRDPAVDGLARVRPRVRHPAAGRSARSGCCSAAATR